MYTAIIDRENANRAALERFIKEKFRCSYQARLDSFPDTLFAVYADDGRPISATGLRSSEDGFFSETYLDLPLETAASFAAGAPVSRNTILEVTNLSSVSSHAVFPLMAEILSHGREQGFSYGVFTATHKLRSLFDRLTLPLVPIAPACPRKFADASRWGSYYDADPWVCLMPNPKAPPEALFPRCNMHKTSRTVEATVYG